MPSMNTTHVVNTYTGYTPPPLTYTYDHIILVGGQCPTCQGNKYRPVKPLNGNLGVGVCLSCKRDHTFLNDFFAILRAAQDRR